jgi:hypothetical protein
MIDVNTILAGAFHNQLSLRDRSSRPKKPQNQQTSELSENTDQMVLTEKHRIFHPAATQYTFFSGFHGTFYKVDLVNQCIKQHYPDTKTQ